MPQRTDCFDLARLGLSAGEARRLELSVAIAPFTFGGERYAVSPGAVPVRIDVSRTTGSGYALRLRFTAVLDGPCMRCLDPATPSFDVDAREVSLPGGGEELLSPYVDEDGDLDVAGWARDALALALPAAIACMEECRGLCPQCGANLNAEPEHAHVREPDRRWAKLSELRFE
jgi:uncharacterized protein